METKGKDDRMAWSAITLSAFGKDVGPLAGVVAHSNGEPLALIMGKAGAKGARLFITGGVAESQDGEWRPIALSWDRLRERWRSDGYKEFREMIEPVALSYFADDVGPVQLAGDPALKEELEMQSCIPDIVMLTTAAAAVMVNRQSSHESQSENIRVFQELGTVAIKAIPQNKLHDLTLLFTRLNGLYMQPTISQAPALLIGGAKLRPLTLAEISHPGNPKLPAWREWFVDMLVNELVASGVIDQQLPFTPPQSFFIEGAGADFFANHTQHERYQRAQSIVSVRQLLAEARRLTQEQSRTESVGSETASALDSHLLRALRYVDAKLVMTDVALLKFNGYVGRSLKQFAQMIHTQTFGTDSPRNALFRNMRMQEIVWVDWLYTLYVLHSRLGVLHMDLHAGNVVVGHTANRAEHHVFHVPHLSPEYLEEVWGGDDWGDSSMEPETAHMETFTDGAADGAADEVDYFSTSSAPLAQLADPELEDFIGEGDDAEPDYFRTSAPDPIDTEDTPDEETLIRELEAERASAVGGSQLDWGNLGGVCGASEDAWDPSEVQPNILGGAPHKRTTPRKTPAETPAETPAQSARLVDRRATLLGSRRGPHTIITDNDPTDPKLMGAFIDFSRAVVADSAHVRELLLPEQRQEFADVQQQQLEASVMRHLEVFAETHGQLAHQARLAFKAAAPYPALQFRAASALDVASVARAVLTVGENPHKDVLALAGAIEVGAIRDFITLLDEEEISQHAGTPVDALPPKDWPALRALWRHFRGRAASAYIAPAEVLEHSQKHSKEYERVLAADTQYPVLALEVDDGGPFLLFDGAHRLAKLILLEKKASVQVRYISAALFAELEWRPEDEGPWVEGADGTHYSVRRAWVRTANLAVHTVPADRVREILYEPIWSKFDSIDELRADLPLNADPRDPANFAHHVRLAWRRMRATLPLPEWFTTDERGREQYVKLHSARALALQQLAAQHRKSTASDSTGSWVL